MALTAADYLVQLQALLPQGFAWPRQADAALTKLLLAWADEMARIDDRAADLVEEADPRTTADLLADRERVAGLPDACVEALAGTQTTAQRRAALVAKLTTIGGQSAAYYIALAASLGYTITITEYKTFTVRSKVNDPLNDLPWRFVFTVNAPLNMVRRFTVRSSVNEPLAAWGNDLLECVISRLKPAHTHVLFAYQ
jgi:uncharacterized protein YmfQ (DUF2313 family)